MNFKFIVSFLKSARKDDNIGIVLREYSTWIEKERKKLYNKLHLEEPLGRSDKLLSPSEEKLIAIIYMNLTRTMQSNSVNFDALLHAIKKHPSKFTDNLKKIEKDFTYELLIEIERRSAADNIFRDQLDKAAKNVDNILYRITPLVTEFNQENYCDGDDTPDIVFVEPSVVIILTLLVVVPLVLKLADLGESLSKDDD